MFTEELQTSNGLPLLKPIAPTADAINLNIVYAERPTADPVVQNELWREIDQIATIAPEQRKKLRELGLAVGITGSQPPRTLQRILGLKSELTDHAQSSRQKALLGRDIVLRSGTNYPLQTSSMMAEVELPPHLFLDDSIKTMKQVRCVMQVDVERLQDGWVKLSFTPQLHYGAVQMRPHPGDHDWELREGQNVKVLYEYKFDVTVSLGEMVVLGRQPGMENTLGELFFVGENNEGQTSRVYVIRLADMQTVQPIYQK
jgi:hypothetical protein